MTDYDFPEVPELESALRDAIAGPGTDPRCPRPAHLHGRYVGIGTGC